MIKVGIVNKNGEVYSKDFKTRDEADTYILEEAEKGIKKVIITNAIYPNDREIINF
jgi:hypothetical protein